MAYTTINKSSLFMNPKLYTGNGSTQSITGVGFQPGFTWIKNRSDNWNHVAYDAVRGVTKQLVPNENSAESTNANGLTAFGSDGFTVGNEGPVNYSSEKLVAWNWKAGTTSGLSGGTITPSSYSINSTSGFGIYKYTGTGSAGTIASGLPSVKCFIIKALDASSNGWVVYHQDLGTNKYLQLDETSAPYTGTSQFNDTAPTTSSTNSLISVGTAGSSNSNGRDYIMYAFSELQGYSKFGSYTGNGNADGTFIYTGFKPSFVLQKQVTSAGENWLMKDNKRGPLLLQDLPINRLDANLLASANTAETNADYIDLLSNGFKCRDNGGAQNGSGTNYIYITFGQSIVGTNNVPATAR